MQQYSPQLLYHGSYEAGLWQENYLNSLRNFYLGEILNFLIILRRKVGFNIYSVTCLVRATSAIYQEKILPEFDS